MGIRILVVEDEAPMREFLNLTLSVAFPRSAIRTAETGQIALQHARELSPDLVLLDLTLPDMDGLVLADELRSIAGGTSVIVAVTARDYPAEREGDECDQVTCMRLGRFSQRELERMLNALLEAITPGVVRKVEGEHV